MTATAVLLLAGVMQSWGDRSMFSDRGTLAHPTRSGVVGLLACALGSDRAAGLEWSDHLTIHVRADQPGEVTSDFHTIGGSYPDGRGMITANGKPRKNTHGQPSTTMSTRRYLADAAFLVTITGPDQVVATLATALRAPRWPIYLGRKGAVPSHPVLLSVTTADPSSVLATTPAYRSITTAGRRPAAVVDDFDALQTFLTANAVPNGSVAVTTYLDGVAPGHADLTINDRPVSFDPHHRTYQPRPVGLHVHNVPTAGTGLTGWLAQHAHLMTLPRAAA